MQTDTTKTGEERPVIHTDTVEQLRHSARRLRFDYIGTGSHDAEAAELDALADWLEASARRRPLR